MGYSPIEIFCMGYLTFKPMVLGHLSWHWEHVYVLLAYWTNVDVFCLVFCIWELTLHSEQSSPHGVTSPLILFIVGDDPVVALKYCHKHVKLKKIIKETWLLFEICDDVHFN